MTSRRSLHTVRGAVGLGAFGLGALLAALWHARHPARDPLAHPATPELMVARLAAPFLEDEPVPDPRVLAWMECELSAAGAGVRLRIRARSQAPSIDPAPGWRGVRGSNTITARELEQLLATGGLQLLTTGGSLREPRPGSVRPGRRGALALRALEGDALRWDATQDGLLEAELESGLLEPGHYRSSVVARGRSRFEVEFVCDGHRAEILSAAAPDPRL